MPPAKGIHMAAPRYVCIHGHFYQPPRENPWLEAVEVQDSASPYHDWNERITRECYAPNTRSRLLDGEGHIANLINNYAWMSFNFGPTLLSWLAENSPDVLTGIAAGDRIARERSKGHGNALAQAYNHMIMPLASDRDKRTQVAWGIADFRHRFERDPEGMWLPEAAVDTASLEVLAGAGIRFTVLAPRQAKRWRKPGDEKWDETPGAIDPSRAYQCKLPSGRSIALFFYDGNISQQVAFERLLDSGERLLERLLGGFRDDRAHPQLVHIATDGESYGHHHRFGDMALAFVLDRLRQRTDLRLMNYGEYLELHPPEWEVEIHDNSSWSCVHGVERWRSNCGCRSRGDWQQQWRGPMRQALDHLKGRLDEVFAERGPKYFNDAWAARDGFIRVILDREEASVRRFLQEFARANLDEAATREVLWLLEMQRHAMLMFTSCGWFFDEISGLETTQCLRYAARAIQLAQHFDRVLEPEILPILEKAPSNLPEYRNGRVVWEKLIRPERIDLERVLAHQAISLTYRPQQPRPRVFSFDVEILDQEVHTRGSSRLGVGRLQVRSLITWNRAETAFAVIHYGGLDFYTVLRKTQEGDGYVDFKKRLVEAYDSGSLADVTEMLMREFGGQVHRLDDLFAEEQRQIIDIALQERFRDYRSTFERLADQDQDLMNLLGRLHFPIPKPMRAAASAYLDHHLRSDIAALAGGGDLQHLTSLYERGRGWGYQPERELVGRTISDLLLHVLSSISPAADVPDAVARASMLLDAATVLEIKLDLWPIQNRLLDTCARLREAGALPPNLHELFGTLAVKMNVSPALLGQQF
jgi:alpha-amylase/alpha-mannosidase (GH57 family)